MIYWGLFVMSMGHVSYMASRDLFTSQQKCEQYKAIFVKWDGDDAHADRYMCLQMNIDGGIKQ